MGKNKKPTPTAAPAQVPEVNLESDPPLQIHILPGVTMDAARQITELRVAKSLSMSDLWAACPDLHPKHWAKWMAEGLVVPDLRPPATRPRMATPPPSAPLGNMALPPLVTRHCSPQGATNVVTIPTDNPFGPLRPLSQTPQPVQMTGTRPKEYPLPQPPQEDPSRQQAPSPAVLEMDQLRDQVSQLQARMEDSLNGIMSQLRHLCFPPSRSNSPYDDRSHGTRFVTDGPLYDQGYPDLQPPRQVTFQQMGTPQNVGHPPSYPLPHNSVPSPRYTSTPAPPGPMAPLDLSVRPTPRWHSPAHESYGPSRPRYSPQEYGVSPSPYPYGATRTPYSPYYEAPPNPQTFGSYPGAQYPPDVPPGPPQRNDAPPIPQTFGAYSGSQYPPDVPPGPPQRNDAPPTPQTFGAYSGSQYPPDVPPGPPRRNDALVKKIPTYNGLSQWEPFIQQFEQIARFATWTESETIAYLHFSLRGEALKHFTYLSDRTDYAAIKSKMRELFQVEITAATARMSAYSLRQKENESEESFAKRILDMVRIGYHPEDRNQSQMAADFFVRGCRDAEAKRTVLNAEPKTLQEAIRLMKQAIAADSIAFGKPARDRKSRRPEYSVRKAEVKESSDSDSDPEEPEVEVKQIRSPTPNKRQVRFKSSSSKTSQETPKSPQKSDSSRGKLFSLEDLVRILGDRNSEASSQRSSPSSPRRSPNHGRCFSCNEAGHFAAECPSKPTLAKQTPATPDPLNKAGLGKQAST